MRINQILNNNSFKNIQIKNNSNFSSNSISNSFDLSKNQLNSDAISFSGIKRSVKIKKAGKMDENSSEEAIKSFNLKDFEEEYIKTKDYYPQFLKLCSDYKAGKKLSSKQLDILADLYARYVLCLEIDRSLLNNFLKPTKANPNNKGKINEKVLARRVQTEKVPQKHADVIATIYKTKYSEYFKAASTQLENKDYWRMEYEVPDGHWEKIGTDYEHRQAYHEKIFGMSEDEWDLYQFLRWNTR